MYSARDLTCCDVTVGEDRPTTTEDVTVGIQLPPTLDLVGPLDWLTGAGLAAAGSGWAGFMATDDEEAGEAALACCDGDGMKTVVAGRTPKQWRAKYFGRSI